MAALVVYLLLPQSVSISYGAFVGVFLLATGAGIISHVPAGIGVFETIVLLLLPGDVSTPAILSGLFAYRVIYYLIPLAAAATLLAGHEIRRAGATIDRVRTAVGRRALPLAPHAFAATVFLSGLVLLVSGATPASGSRLVWRNHSVPLPLIEASHFLASIAGTALLFLARALQRRLDAAYYLILALLGAGIVWTTSSSS